MSYANNLAPIACLSGATAVALGAFGAHSLKDRLSSYQQESWKTAVSYQLVHSGVLLLVATLPALPSSSQAGGARSFAAAALGSGIALFSGSIYGLCLTKEGDGIRKALGPATPIGGLALIAGWVSLAVSFRGGIAPRLR
ncbi:DUF423-domain-containing protein [Tilletiopsis washingtonensis]|uniref:DUF423-domain-containing protein n=1 Tax=Tilletiopsis washingtonensis TaxID=58919 RepID=A0A316Z4K6_9BASI|nr:DUF423-domain-containing protein [Tilletiopsis washingtonensis]PWN96491.1 DUF423-domain-containing protein [Tilletiopsis washingtonensis]